MEDHGESRYTLEDYWKIIWRRKWMVILFLIAANSIVLIGNSIMAPVYEAAVLLEIKRQATSVIGGDLISSGISNLSTTEEINTQIEIIKSRKILEKVINDLDLINRLGIERVPNREAVIQAAVATLRKNITVKPVTGTRMIGIFYRSEDPVLAKNVCNTISKEFIEQNVESKRAEAAAILSFVSSQIERVSKNLNDSEENLVKYKQQEGIAVLDDEAKLKTDRLSDLESNYQTSKVERGILAAKIKALQNQMGLDSALLNGDQEFSKMQAALTDLQKEGTRLEGATGEAAAEQRNAVQEKIISLKNEIQDYIVRYIEKQDTSALNSSLKMKLAELYSQNAELTAKEDALTNFIGSLEGDIKKFPKQEIHLARLKRVSRINEELYMTLTKARNDAQLEAASKIGNIGVIDEASTPLKAVFPRKKENLIMSFVLSLIIGVGIALLFEFLSNSVRSEEELKHILGEPLLGVIPYFGVDNPLPWIKGKKRDSNNYSLEFLENPMSSASESFRLFCENFKFIDLEKSIKTVLVTSLYPGDGKTTIASNLALALASREERILIVDTDFRVPALHKIFRLNNTPGVTDSITGDMNYSGIIKKIERAPNLDILTCGSVPPNPSELIGSRRMNKMIENMKSEYDRIIFDVPPVLGVTDAVILGSHLDGILLVLKAGKIEKKILFKTLERFRTAKTRILGGILNGIDLKDGRFGDTYYYSYYGHYSRDERKVEKEV